MKRKIKLSLSIILIAVMMLNVVFANDIVSGTITDLTPGDGTADPMAQCIHDYAVFIETHDGHHYYECRKGCGSLEAESCYIFDCSYYPGTLNTLCEKCKRTTFINIHEGLVYVRDWTSNDYTHDVTCQDCNSVIVNDDPCTLNEPVVWCHFTLNNGHRITRTCTKCGFRPTMDYYYPEGHVNGTDPNCYLCDCNKSYVPWTLQG